jgi:hypothetical protein
MKRRFLTLVMAAVVLSASAWAQDGLRGVLSRESYRPRLWPTVAGADLDGDTVPDAAVLVDDGRTLLPGSTHTIEIHLTAQRNARLTFRSQETSLAIAALDVDHDGATDIVVERAITRERLQVWLNDGRGGFRHVDALLFPEPPPVPVHVENRESHNAPCAALPPAGRTRLAFTASRAAPIQARSSYRRLVAAGLLSCSRAIAPTSSRAPPRSL